MTNLKELAAIESLWQLKISLTISEIDLHINDIQCLSNWKELM